MIRFICIAIICLSAFVQLQSEPALREVQILEKGWKFIKADLSGAEQIDYDDDQWEDVTVPHDWAIYGPFDKEIDKQNVAIRQNGERVPREKTGRTGALPFIGTGWYRHVFELGPEQISKKVILQFDGVMSEPEVFLNGKKIGEWAYGYTYFYFDVSDHLVAGENVLAVRATNRPFSSRWYPGAGIYRKVSLTFKNEASVDHWGTTITTPIVHEAAAMVKVKTETSGENLEVVTSIFGPDGKLAAQSKSDTDFAGLFVQNLKVEDPQLWSPETPALYFARTDVFQDGELTDQVTTRFGIRTIKYEADVGFSLNGEVRKFKGVCLHHDLGPIGTAVNKAALRRQLRIMKDMGADSIRSAHNMPAIEQLELADEMGLMFIAESFDEWKKSKVKNGYNLFFDDYAEKDIVNLVRATKNHPAIIMWSAGNEVPDQSGREGAKRARRLQGIFNREDPTRPVTVGMDQVESVMENGFGAILGAPGLNYRVHLYEGAYEKFPQGFILGSETASTVSSRGIYKFPPKKAAMIQHPDLQSSSYDLEYCSWSNLPEDDFVKQDDFPWVIGEFVWTGFDYLGEPTPYDRAWPSRSSYFGIVDLAGIPKDRYYLYKSRWNTEDDTLHILPHWNWPDRVGKKTPVFVYTNYPSAELFLNGVSQGVQTKTKEDKLGRYRLMWNDVVYQPGELEVVAYDDSNKAVKRALKKTSGPAATLRLEADRLQLHADGRDLAFVTVSAVDEEGIFCPTALHQLSFEVSGKGVFRAACNGDATSLLPFHLPQMHLFSGQLVVIIQSTQEVGAIRLTVSGAGLEDGTIELRSE